jgi:phosphonate transport system permease protein
MSVPAHRTEPEDLRHRRAELRAAGRGRRRAMLAVALLLLLLTVLGLWRVEATPARLWEGLSRLGFLVGFMWPPTPGGELPRLLYALAETLAIALLGTLAAAILAFPLGFLAARNTSPGWLMRWPLRRSMDVLRGVDVLIIALIFISAIGLGPFAGILAIAVNDTGNFTKLYSESIENARPEPVRGTLAAGGNRVEAVRFGLVPQVFPVMLSHVLFLLESNVRSASIIGLVGAGGIGFELSERIRGNYWDQVAFIILMLLVTVYTVDRISHGLRAAIIGGRENTGT